MTVDDSLYEERVKESICPWCGGLIVKESCCEVAVREERAKIREWLKSNKVKEIMSNEISDLGSTEQLTNNLLKEFDEAFPKCKEGEDE